MKFKLSAKAKEELKSYLRSVGVATITLALAIAADIRPEYAVLLGSVAAPLFKAVDPSYKGFGVGSKK